MCLDREISEKNSFAILLPDYFRIDLRVGFKWIGRRSSREVAIDLRNLTNRENSFYIKYDVETGDLTTKRFGFTPDLLYRIIF